VAKGLDKVFHRQERLCLVWWAGKLSVDRLAEGQKRRTGRL